AAVALPSANGADTSIESASRHSPPNNTTWSAVSLSVDRLTYCCGRLRPSSSAPTGAHCGATSLATRPAKLRAARPRSPGPPACADPRLCIQKPAAISIGMPGVTPGYSDPPRLKNPLLAKVRPWCAPPKAAACCGIGSPPCCADQYPACRYVP